MCAREDIKAEKPSNFLLMMFGKKRGNRSGGLQTEQSDKLIGFDVMHESWARICTKNIRRSDGGARRIRLKIWLSCCGVYACVTISSAVNKLMGFLTILKFTVSKNANILNSCDYWNCFLLLICEFASLCDNSLSLLVRIIA